MKKINLFQYIYQKIHLIRVCLFLKLHLIFLVRFLHGIFLHKTNLLLPENINKMLLKKDKTVVSLME